MLLFFIESEWKIPEPWVEDNREREKKQVI